MDGPSAAGFGPQSMGGFGSEIGRGFGAGGFRGFGGGNWMRGQSGFGGGIMRFLFRHKKIGFAVAVVFVGFKISNWWKLKKLR